MAEELTLNEFIASIGELRDELNDPGDFLTEYASTKVEEMKRLAPISVGGGALRNSIGYQIEGTNITFRMLQYGFYQNYGVIPNRFTSNPKPFAGGPLRRPWAEPEFGIPMGGGYQEPRQFGMMARQFFSLQEINEEITTSIAEATANF